MSRLRPRVLFLGSLYAGHRTRFANLRAHVEADPRIEASFRGVSGWIDGGAIERLPLLPAAAKGRLRALREASAFATLPRPDAVWSAVSSALLPFAWAQLGPLRRPLVLDLDETLELRERYAEPYYRRAPRRGLRARTTAAGGRAVRRRDALRAVVGVHGRLAAGARRPRRADPRAAARRGPRAVPAAGCGADRRRGAAASAVRRPSCSTPSGPTRSSRCASRAARWS